MGCSSFKSSSKKSENYLNRQYINTENTNITKGKLIQQDLNIKKYSNTVNDTNDISNNNLITSEHLITEIINEITIYINKLNFLYSDQPKTAKLLFKDYLENNPQSKIVFKKVLEIRKNNDLNGANTNDDVNNCVINNNIDDNELQACKNNTYNYENYDNYLIRNIENENPKIGEVDGYCYNSFKASNLGYIFNAFDLEEEKANINDLMANKAQSSNPYRKKY